MNLLILSHLYPFPPDDGGRIVTFNTIEFLKRRGHRIHIVTFSPREVETELDSLAEVHVVEKDTAYRLPEILKNLFSPLAVNTSKYIDKRVFDKIEKVLERAKIDLVLVEHLHMAFYGKAIKKTYPAVPVVLRQHNVESTIMKRFCENQANPLAKAYARLQYKKLYRYESEIVSVFDRCIVLTRNDFRRLKKMNNAVEARVVNAGVDTGRYFPMDGVPMEGDTILFVGSMEWRPNEDAVNWFLDRVFGRVAKEFPSACLLVVGKDPPARLVKRANGKNVTITGRVPDERPYLAKAAAVVVPLRIGGGMRIKILNAMAMGKCVVSTAVGAEGIDAVDRETIVLADAPDAFARKLCELLRNPSAAKKIGVAARKLALEKYAWPVVLGRLEDELNRVAKGKRSI